ncbi:MAG: hypothetical protein WC713_08360 [Candidatus Methylomirabilota bacterium]
MADPRGRITPGTILLLGALAGAGWFLLQPQDLRTTMTCDSVNTLAEWVEGDGGVTSEWDRKVKEAVANVKRNCPDVLDRQATPVVHMVIGKAKEQVGNSLHLTVGAANQLREGRRVMAVIDGRTLKIAGIGTSRLLGITIPPENEQAATEFLVQCCLEKRLTVHKHGESDAEGYPLIVLFAAHNPKEALAPGLAINQQLLNAGLAEPWALSVHTPYWSNRPDPAL